MTDRNHHHLHTKEKQNSNQRGRKLNKSDNPDNNNNNLEDNRAHVINIHQTHLIDISIYINPINMALVFQVPTISMVKVKDINIISNNLSNSSLLNKCKRNNNHQSTRRKLSSRRRSKLEGSVVHVLLRRILTKKPKQYLTESRASKNKLKKLENNKRSRNQYSINLHQNAKNLNNIFHNLEDNNHKDTGINNNKETLNKKPNILEDVSMEKEQARED